MSTKKLASSLEGLKLTKQTSRASTRSNSPPPPEEKTTLMSLPAEVRAEIWGYLLDGDYVRGFFHMARPEHECVRYSGSKSRLYSHARTYQFQTNILLVNRRIYAEARDELRRRNDFVLFGYQWVSPHTPEYPFDEMYHCHNVPIVTDNQSAIASFDHESLRLHFRHRELPEAEYETYKTGYILMLAHDLVHLFQAITMVSCNKWKAGKLLLKNEADGKLREFTGLDVDKTFKLTIQLRQFFPVKDFRKKAAHILSSLGRPIISAFQLALATNATPYPRQGASLWSAPEVLVDVPEDLLAELQASAGPERVWLTAWAYDTFDMLKQQREYANVLISLDGYLDAAVVFDVMFDSWYRPILFGTFAPENPIYASDAAEPLILWLRELLNAIIASGSLKLRTLIPASVARVHKWFITKPEDTKRAMAEEFWLRICKFSKDDMMLNTSEQFPGARWDLVCPGYKHLQYLLRAEDHCRSNTGPNPDLEAIIADFEELRSYNPYDQYLAHDCNLVGTLRYHQKETILPLASTAVLPVREFEWQYKDTELGRPPIEGWTVLSQMHEVPLIGGPFRTDSTA